MDSSLLYIVLRNKQFLFLICHFFHWELDVWLGVHLIPLILYTEENPLEAAENLQGGNCEHSEVIMAKMGRELVRPCATQDKIASYHPKINLQSMIYTITSWKVLQPTPVTESVRRGHFDHSGLTPYTGQEIFTSNFINFLKNF